jgi:RNA polymerase sigma-70 factor, ECF subfamily
VDGRVTGAASYLGDETTVELLVKAQAGDRVALEAILQRSLPPVRRWAHGRLPSSMRGEFDTDDLVQQAAAKALARLDHFRPQHVGAMQAYLRSSIINLIRDIVRQTRRTPIIEDLPPEMPSPDHDTDEWAIAQETYERYREALARLKPRERDHVVARIEGQWSYREIAERFGHSVEDSARVATARALAKLRAHLTELLAPPGGR